MRRLPLTLLALALALPASAQETARWGNKFFSGKDEPAPPVILHDFGVLPKGTVKTYRFQMANIYAVPMQVSEPKASCGCVSIVEYTGKMGPRETGHIEVRIDTGRFDGPKTVEIPVRFDGRDPKTGESFWSYARLEVRAVSRPDIAIDPGAVDFKVVPAGQKAVQVVNIVYTGRQRDWKVTEVSHKNDALDVVVVPKAAAGGVRYELRATLKDTAPAGDVFDQIVLKTTDPDRQGASLTVTVSGQVQAPLSLVPGDQMKMGGVEVGKKLEKNVIVRADKPFRVKAVDGQGEGVSVSLIPLPAAKSQVLTVTFAPEKPGPVKRVLTIKTDTGESVPLTVEGTGTEPQ